MIYQFKRIPEGSHYPRAGLQVLDAIKRVSLEEATPQDAKIFYDWILMEAGGLLESSFATDKDGLTAFNEGRRFVALLIREATNAAQEQLEKMRKGE